MKYLLDTCVISELIKIKPNENVVNWVSKNNDQDLYLSTITFGEINKGIEKLSNFAKKTKLHNWVEHELKERFKNRILPINLDVAMIWGRIQGKAELVGKPMPAIDGLIATTGIVYDMVIVTRDVSDMQQSNAELFNPWE